VGRDKGNRAMWNRPAAAAVLLTVSLLLAVGGIWARYQTNLVTYADYSAAEAASVFLWSGMEVAIEDNARHITFDAAGGAWERNITTGDPELYFYVSNGESSESYAGEDMAVSIRLVGSLGSSLTEELESGPGIQLTVDGQSFIGIARKIDEDSPIYQTVGAGWVISFVDDTGEEYHWHLEGGKLSVMEAVVEVTGMELDAASMMTLQVSGEAAR